MKKNKEKNTLDPLIEQFYNLGLEKDRLKQGIEQLERERILTILKKNLPSAPAEVLDVGGAAGSYAFLLAEQGYEVHLIDPVPLHIEQAREVAKATNVKLASYTVGDGRSIDKDDCSADVVLFLGPLYHLVEYQDRLKALKEAHRILKPNGLLVAAAIPRFAFFIYGIYQGAFLDPTYREIVREDLSSGQHRTTEARYFTTAYLHHPVQLRNEIEESGFKNVSLYSVHGPVWHEEAIEKLKSNREAWESFLSFLEMIEKEESIIGASAHILAIARK